jgi:hypothetical protein
MIRRPLLAFLSLALIGSTFLLWPRVHVAEAVLDGGERVALRLRPMVSLHSDWHRDLIVRDADGRRRIRLFEDTGWWRGSQLYRRPDGALVLDEGQAGCILLSDVAGPTGCPVATGCTYRGRFDERTARDGNRVMFQGPEDAPEIDLPAAL